MIYDQVSCAVSVCSWSPGQCYLIIECTHVTYTTYTQPTVGNVLNQKLIQGYQSVCLGENISTHMPKYTQVRGTPDHVTSHMTRFTTLLQPLSKYIQYSQFHLAIKVFDISLIIPWTLLLIDPSVVMSVKILSIYILFKHYCQTLHKNLIKNHS